MKGAFGAAVLVALAPACLPGMEPMKAAPPSAGALWKPPQRSSDATEAPVAPASLEYDTQSPDGVVSGPPPLGGGRRDITITAEDLSLPELAAIALQLNPSTQRSWAAARAAAAAHGESQSSYYPAIEIGAGVTRQRGLMQGGRVFFENTNLGPGARLAFLVLDSAPEARARTRLGRCCLPQIGSTTKLFRTWSFRSPRSTTCSSAPRPVLRWRR